MFFIFGKKKVSITKLFVVILSLIIAISVYVNHEMIITLNNNLKKLMGKMMACSINYYQMVPPIQITHNKRIQHNQTNQLFPLHVCNCKL